MSETKNEKMIEKRVDETLDAARRIRRVSTDDLFSARLRARLGAASLAEAAGVLPLLLRPASVLALIVLLAALNGVTLYWNRSQAPSRPDIGSNDFASYYHLDNGVDIEQGVRHD